MRTFLACPRAAGARAGSCSLIPARHLISFNVQPKVEQRCVAVKAATPGAPGVDRYVLPNGVVDYYEVLGVDDNAGTEEIKKAYRALAKECHPDYLGDEGHNICILLNEAYEILSTPNLRGKYDAELEQALVEASDAYTGQPLSKWIPSVAPNMAKNKDPAETRAVFVDELTCVGCRNCIWCAPATFRLENEHGRSRVFGQWLNTEEQLQDAIDSCPVSCIHWVQKEDLPALEYVTQVLITERPNVGMLMSGLGRRMADVFQEAATFTRERKELAARKAAAAGMKYSAAQEAARRQAAESLLNKTNWFSTFQNNFAGSFSGMFSNVAQAVYSTVGSEGMVGQRKRRVRWDERERLNDQLALEEAEQGYSVPRERALVPVSVYVNTTPTLLRRAASWGTVAAVPVGQSVVS